MSLQIVGAFPTFELPRKSVAFGTAFTSIVKPRNRRKPKVTLFKYTDGGTAHTLTWMAPLARTKITTAIAASGTAAILARDPGNYSANFAADALIGPNTAGPLGYIGPIGSPVVANNLIAASDWILIQGAGQDNWHLTLISAPTTNADGTVSLTLTTAAPTGGIPAGATVFFLGITTDSHPVTGLAHYATTSGAGTSQTSYDANGGALVEPWGLGEPLVFHSNNATATGSLDYATGVYADR